MTKFTIKQLLDHAVHFGHSVSRWNPKMAPYIYGVYNKNHIIDLQRTAPLLNQALEALRNISRNNGRIVFVGTKKQASEIIKAAAEKSGQYYVNHRWLGGMLTNWKTISKSIHKLNDLDKKILDSEGITKKERGKLINQRDKMELALGGIRKMGGLPDALLVIDTIKESLAIEEARKLKIPVIAVVDTNSDPDLVDFPVPGNDDATKSIKLYCELFSSAILEGIKDSLDMAEAKKAEKAEKAENSKKEKAAKVAKSEPQPVKVATEKTTEATSEVLEATDSKA